jgi:peptidoglycan/xylan/chitin deacetylase (PgdA/CDA1 family)
MAAAHQPNLLAPLTKTIVTTFYDIEGDYAVPGQHGACIDTIPRILEIEKKYAIRSTYNVVARFALDIPDLLLAIRNAGHEIASHSYDHKILRDLSRHQLAENILRTKEVFSELGIRPIGHRSPQSTWTRELMRLLFQEGFQWTAENGRETYPYVLLRDGAAALWRFPVTDDDWHYMRDGLRPTKVLSIWQNLVQRARETRRYTAIGFHPWIETAADRLAVLDEFLHWLSEQDDVQVMPFGRVLGRIHEQEQLLLRSAS